MFENELCGVLFNGLFGGSCHTSKPRIDYRILLYRSLTYLFNEDTSALCHRLSRRQRAKKRKKNSKSDCILEASELSESRATNAPSKSSNFFPRFLFCTSIVYTCYQRIHTFVPCNARSLTPVHPYYKQSKVILVQMVSMDSNLNLPRHWPKSTFRT